MRAIKAIRLGFESRSACDTGSKSSRLIADELIGVFLFVYCLSPYWISVVIASSFYEDVFSVLSGVYTVCVLDMSFSSRLSSNTSLTR